MECEPADNGLRIVHFDTGAGRLRAREAESPLILAPWRVWLRGGYRPCPDLDSFRDELWDCPDTAPATVLLHEGDFDDACEADDLALAEWLDAHRQGGRPVSPRHIVLYGSNLRSWGECSRDSVLFRSERNITFGRHWGSRLTAMPFETHILGDARPVAWLGHLLRPDTIDLALLSQPFGTWRDRACREILELKLPERWRDGTAVWEGFEGDHHSVGLRLYLESRIAGAERGGGLRANISILGDNLWLLEGIVRSGGDRSKDDVGRIEYVRRMLEIWCRLPEEQQATVWPQTRKAIGDQLGAASRSRSQHVLHGTPRELTRAAALEAGAGGVSARQFGARVAWSRRRRDVSAGYSQSS